MEAKTSNDAKRQTRIFYHGTNADLKIGDVIVQGFNSNHGTNKNAKYVYLSETIDAATWGAELAFGTVTGRIYIVEPTGFIEDDPNLTDKKFPGNPKNHTAADTQLRLLANCLNGKDIRLNS